MANSNGRGTSVAGSKTGVLTLMQLDGAEGDLRRTGMFKRKPVPDKPESSPGKERQERPARPDSLPEINTDDGGTTGIVHLDSEGQDSAERESHPR